MKSNLKKIAIAAISNVISFGVSAITTFLLPKNMGIDDYGYLQLYLFYINYTGMLHFGWADGIFLRYGGEYYDKLDRNKFSAQFWLFFAIEFSFGCILGLIGYYCSKDANRALILGFTGLATIFLLPKTFLQYILQCTNRVKEYANSIIIERIIYFIAIIFALFSNKLTFITVIYIELMGKLVALIYSVYQCRTILFAKPEPIYAALRETKQNIQVGIKLMFSNVASMLILGIVRISIENRWDVATFAKLSLTLSVSNLLMVFIRAVALVMFPILRRTSQDKLADIYSVLRTCLMVPLLGMLVLYYPCSRFLIAWLPSYADSLKYMAILFPICIFESKMSMLIETYMKTMRKESHLMLVNITAVGLSFILTWLSVYKLENLDLAVFSIVALFAFRCISAELTLSTELDVKVKKDIIFEISLTLFFIVSSWFIGGTTGLLLYTTAYFVYLGFKFREIQTLFILMKTMLRR